MCKSVIVNSELPLVDNTHKYFDFRRANYTKISAFLNSFNWLETIRLLDVNSSSDALYDALHFCMLNFVPEVVYTSSTFPHWFSKGPKSIVFSKKVAHAKYKASRCLLDYNAFSNLWSRYKFEYKKCYKSFLFQTENKLKQNPRTFWDFIRKNASCSAIPNAAHWDNITCSGPESISNLFSSYFNTVYVNTPTSIKQLPDIPCFHPHLPSNCEISLIDVENGLSSLNNVKSADPDGLPGTFLFNIRSAIYFPLWLIFCRLLKGGTYPS